MKRYLVNIKRVTVGTALSLAIIIQFVLNKKYTVELPVVIYYLGVGLIIGIITSMVFQERGVPVK